MASVASDRELINAVVAEMADGIDCAVGFWIGQIEDALLDPHLTTLGRLHAVRAIVENYRHTTTDAGTKVDGYVA